MAKPSPIGEQVARLRVLRGWSQEELAHRASVAVDTVRKLESGTRGMVRLHTLNRISAALDVELSVALVVPPLLPPVAAGGLLAIRTALTSADLVGLAEYAEAGVSRRTLRTAHVHRRASTTIHLGRATR